jgi:hypothetical protein
MIRREDHLIRNSKEGRNAMGWARITQEEEARQPGPDPRQPPYPDPRQPPYPDPRQPEPEPRRPDPDPRRPDPDPRQPGPDPRQPDPDPRHGLIVCEGNFGLGTAEMHV